MDVFQKLESLVDSAGADDVEAASALTRKLKGASEPIQAAIDDFMLDFRTLVFVVESGEDGHARTARKLARARLASLQQLMGVEA
ncbi:hypothetical protein [Mesorhizobium sp. ES1-1]|uniref:hypothetical protein n=1 Tax=Mesorhizobium sp. ES1-1 TaxID=2876629 RepID=UPI001CC91451|nr:hypothetical protein [Mesorhizobium sp. ES1-1]MBZ9675686.1 hypothetical protein [Mesorhizobium sp. ES1-1]